MDDTANHAVIFSCSPSMVECCAPWGMQREVVERQVNFQHPRRDGRRWAVCSVPTASPNPCPCNCDAGRLHWLLISPAAREGAKGEQ